MNPLMDSPPKIKIAINTISVVSEVLRVLLKVLFNAVLTVVSLSQDL